jgi:hypothetical protein
VLKSACSFWMLPEIWLPTCTFTTALSCPVAVTVLVMSTIFTAAVWYCGFSSRFSK